MLCARIISKRPATVFVKASPNGYLIKASPSPDGRFTKGGAMAALSGPNGRFIKASPVWPFCQEQPNCMAILLSKSNSKFIKDSPRATSSRQPQWLFYQSKWPSHQSQLPLYQSQWPFYQSRLLKAGHGNLSRPAQWQLYDGCGGKGQPLGLALGGPADLIEAGPDGKFIKASSNRKGKPLDLVLGGSTRYCAA